MNFLIGKKMFRKVLRRRQECSRYRLVSLSATRANLAQFRGNYFIVRPSQISSLEKCAQLQQQQQQQQQRRRQQQQQQLLKRK